MKALKQIVAIDLSEVNTSSSSSTSDDDEGLSFAANTQLVHRSWFDAAAERSENSSLKDFRRYPPFSNKHYELTSAARFPESKRLDLGSPLTFPAPAVKLNPVMRFRKVCTAESLLMPVPPEAQPKPPSSPVRGADGLTNGERLAVNIKWNRSTWVNQPVGAAFPLMTPEEIRQDFIDNIDSGAKMLMCTKCSEAHIPPGPPITLQDRDTCGSFLPEWFPAKEFDKPWDTFRQMFNQLAVLDEMQEGISHQTDPEQQEWDLNYHEKDPKWQGLRGRNRREGWWKCRSGSGATAAELSCNICHATKTAEELARADQRRVPIAARRAAMMDWIEAQIKTRGLADEYAEDLRRSYRPL